MAFLYKNYDFELIIHWYQSQVLSDKMRSKTRVNIGSAFAS